MVSLNLKVGKVRAVVTVPAGARVADIRRAAEPFLVGDEWAQVRSGARQCRVIHAGKSLSRNAAPLEDEGVHDGAQVMVAGMEPVAAGAAVADVPPPVAEANTAAVEDDVVDEDDEEAMLQAALKASVEECAGEGEDVQRGTSEPMEVDGGSDDELAAALRMSAAAAAAGDGAAEGEDDEDEETRAALRLSMEEAEKEEAEKRKKQEEKEKEKEEEYEEIEFERFDSSNVHVAEDTMEELKKYYSEDNRYVDAQFPPLPRSIFLDPKDAERWLCSGCGRAHPLPDTKPPPTSREEAEQQQAALDAIRCSCGTGPTHVQMVNIVNRPSVWLRPGTRCAGCELIFSHTEGVKDVQGMVSRQCTHYIRDDITQNTVGGLYKVVRDKPRAEDVYQGALGNCWFGGALACVAERPALVSNMLVTGDYNPLGAYMVKLHHNGAWRSLLIDDSFPCSKAWEGRMDPNGTIYFSRGGHMCFAKAARQSLWVPLVEKAAAKLFGSYGALSGGTLAEALQLFTGYACDTVQLRRTHQQEEAVRQRRARIAEMRTQLLLQGKNPDEVPLDDGRDDDEAYDADIVWSRLFSAKEAGYIMGTACSAEACGSTREHFVEKLGLQTPHAYSVLQVREVAHAGRVVRLLQFRNPWGERAPRTWQGDWGAKWDGWTRELQLELGVTNTSGVKMYDEASIFWIAFDDARKYFASIDICRVHPTAWKCASAVAWLPSDLGPGEHVSIRTYRRTVVDLIVWQEKHITRESALKAITSNVDVMCSLMRKEVGPDGAVAWRCVEHGASTVGDQVSVEVVLEGGFEYRLVPFSVHLMQAGNLSMRLRRATVSCFSDTEVEVKTVSSSWSFVSECVAAAVCQHGKQQKLAEHLSSYTLSGRSGQLLAVQNTSDSESFVVQADYDTRGCLSTLYGNAFSRIVSALPRTRQLCLGVTINGAGGYQHEVQQYPAEHAAFAEPGFDLHAPSTVVLRGDAGWGVPEADESLLQEGRDREAKREEEKRAAEQKAEEEEEERLMAAALAMSEEASPPQEGAGGGEGGGGDSEDEEEAMKKALLMSMGDEAEKEGGGGGGGGGGDDGEDDEMDEAMRMAIELSKHDPENQ